MKEYLTLLIIILPIRIFCQGATNNSITDTNSEKEHGYYNYFSIGTLIGSQKDEKTFINSIQMEHNYQFNKNFAFGIVTGIEWLDVIVAPIGSNIKLILSQKNKLSYYWGASYGYSIALKDMDNTNFKVLDTKGGKFANIEFGFIFPSKKKSNFYLATGYRYQEFIYNREDWWLNEVENKTTYNRFSLKFGIRLY